LGFGVKARTVLGLAASAAPLAAGLMLRRRHR
jgi:hypothetical protein